MHGKCHPPFLSSLWTKFYFVILLDCNLKQKVYFKMKLRPIEANNLHEFGASCKWLVTQINIFILKQIQNCMNLRRWKDEVLKNNKQKEFSSLVLRIDDAKTSFFKFGRLFTRQKVVLKWLENPWPPSFLCLSYSIFL